MSNEQENKVETVEEKKEEGACTAGKEEGACTEGKEEAGAAEGAA